MTTVHEGSQRSGNTMLFFLCVPVEEFVEIPSDSNSFAGDDDSSDSDSDYETNDTAARTIKQRPGARKAIPVVCESFGLDSQR